jgi:Myb-like DNA-binding domain
MPKLSADRPSRKSAPYNLALSTTMPGQVYNSLVAAAAPHDWISYEHLQPNMMPLQDVMNPAPTTPHHQQSQHSQHSPYVNHHLHLQQQQTHHHHHQQQQQQQHQHQHPQLSHHQPDQPLRQRYDPVAPPTPTYSLNHQPPPQAQAAGPWTPHDDELLVKARTKNLAWAAIHEKHFPTKTANACRKRYERLMLKRRGNDWDEDRNARLAVAYKDMREQTWSPLAEQLGERWEHVEKAVSCPDCKFCAAS